MALSQFQERNPLRFHLIAPYEPDTIAPLTNGAEFCVNEESREFCALDACKRDFLHRCHARRPACIDSKASFF